MGSGLPADTSADQVHSEIGWLRAFVQACVDLACVLLISPILCGILWLGLAVTVVDPVPLPGEGTRLDALIKGWASITGASTLVGAIGAAVIGVPFATIFRKFGDRSLAQYVVIGALVMVVAMGLMLARACWDSDLHVGWSDVKAAAVFMLFSMGYAFLFWLAMIVRSRRKVIE